MDAHHKLGMFLEEFNPVRVLEGCWDILSTLY